MLKDLRFMHKSQLNTHFKLSRLEAIIFEKIATETNILRSFLKALINFNQSPTTATTDATFNPLVIEILTKSLANSEHFDPWLKSINSEENFKDKCILNAEKSNVLDNINKLAPFKSQPVVLNSLVNKALGTLLNGLGEEDHQHVSISVYHFIAVQNLIDTSYNEIVLLNNHLVGLQDNPSQWMEELGSTHLYFKNKSFAEIVLASLVKKVVIEDCSESKDASKKFIEKLGSGHTQVTVDALLALVMETLVNFNLKTKPYGTDTQVLRFLRDALETVTSQNVSFCLLTYA